MENLKNKNILVYGTGLSGSSAVSFLSKCGANVFVYDDNNICFFSEAIIVKNFQEIKNYKLDLVVLSPGVQVIGNKNIELLDELKIKYISEFALGFEYSKGTKICITGTNGKTTTVNLLNNIFSLSKKSVFLCGNTDTPITKICTQTHKNSFVICEVSSFALENFNNCVPSCSAILNITEDHLIRHITFENYRQTKLEITKHQTKNEYFVCEDNFDIKTNAQVINYSLNDVVNGTYVKNGFIFYKGKKIIAVNKLQIKGEKNLLNVLCAVTIAKLYKISNAKIVKTLKNFAPLKNRLEKVAEIDGIIYINDSKATNPDSTICAINTFIHPIILLLGGSDKGYNYDVIFQNYGTIKKIIAFGAVRDKIVECATKNNFFEILKTTTMKEAVLLAKNMALSGDIILLSPASASFDEFSSYKHRGEVFCDIVRNIK